MIRLDTTNRKLQLVLGGAVTANQCRVMVSFSEQTATSYSGLTQLTLSNDTTEVDVCDAPAASTIRDIDYVNVHNADTASATVSIILDDSATNYVLVKATIEAGEHLIYTHGDGWSVLSTAGARRTVLTAHASTISYTPSGGLVSTNLQAAVDELEANKADLAAPTFTGVVTASGQLIAGNPGLEDTGITVNGATYESTFKVSDIDGTHVAQTILHRHSTTLEPLLVGARSNSNTSSHAAVTAGQGLFSVYAVGHNGTDYGIGGYMSFQVGTGTVSASSMPGKWILALSANGAEVPTAVITADSDKSVLFGGVVSLQAGTALLPSLTPTGDPNTGLWFPGADTLALSTAGVERMRIGSTGTVGIGTSALAQYGIYHYGSLTGATTAIGHLMSLEVQSDVTSEARGFSTFLSTQADAFTLTSLYHFRAGQGTIGATSAVTNQYGFEARSSLTGATNNYGFYGDIAAGTGRWNLYMGGTAANYFAGQVLVGTPTAILGNLFGSSTSGFPLQIASTSFPAGAAIYGYATAPGITLTRSASASVGGTALISAGQTLGAIQFNGTDGSAVLPAAEVRATADGSPGSGTIPGYLGFYTTAQGAGSVSERMRITSAGLVGIGGTPSAGYNVHISKTLTGNVSPRGLIVDGAIQSDATTDARVITALVSTAAGAFTVPTVYGFLASQGTIGAGSAVTNQHGFSASSALIGATNNYGFYGAIAAATGRWNLYMTGTAQNYLAGNTGIGTLPSVSMQLRIGGSITGGTVARGLIVESTVQSDVTLEARLFSTSLATQAAAFTLPTLTHFHATQGTIGATSTVTSQYGFYAGSTLTGATNNYGFYGNIAAGTGRWNLYMSGAAQNYLAGALGIGSATLTGFNLRMSKTLTGALYSYAVYVDSQIQSDVTTSARGVQTYLGTQAAAFTVSDVYHFLASQGTVGASSAVTRQYGFFVDSSLSGATNNNYGFYGGIAAGTGRWNLYMSGTANNYLAGALGIGGTSLSANNLHIGKNITGGTTARAAYLGATVQSDVTGGAAGYETNILVANAAFTLTALTHFLAYQNTIGASATVTNQYGFRTSSTLTGATNNNYGFYGDIAAGTGRWNLYMSGTADNYLAGSLGIGSTTLTGFNLRMSKTLTGALSSYAVYVDSQIQSDVTTSARGFSTSLGTQAAAFTLPTLTHFHAVQGTIGATSAVTRQYGFYAGSTLTGATNNYGFFGDIAAGSNRWNLYMAGTAMNYLEGNLGLGVAPSASYSLRVSVDMTGSANRLAVAALATVQSDVTGYAIGFGTTFGVADAAFTLPSLKHFQVAQGTFGASATVTNQYGFIVEGSMTGATYNYGFYGAMAAAANRWNLYMAGTAVNYLAGNTGIGTAATATAALSLVASTTSVASLNIPHGSAPSSPVNGDMWTTTAGLYVRINGSTIGPLS